MAEIFETYCFECRSPNRGPKFLGTDGAGSLGLHETPESSFTEWVVLKIPGRRMALHAATRRSSGSWLVADKSYGRTVFLGGTTQSTDPKYWWTIEWEAEDTAFLRCEGESSEKRWLDGWPKATKVKLIDDNMRDAKAGTRWRIHRRRYSSGREGKAATVLRARRERDPASNAEILTRQVAQQEAWPPEAHSAPASQAPATPAARQSKPQGPVSARGGRHLGVALAMAGVAVGVFTPLTIGLMFRAGHEAGDSYVVAAAVAALSAAVAGALTYYVDPIGRKASAGVSWLWSRRLLWLWLAVFGGGLYGYAYWQKNPAPAAMAVFLVALLGFAHMWLHRRE